MDKSLSNLYDDELYNIWILLRWVTDAITRARKKELAKFGFSNVQSTLLFAVLTLGDNATSLEISQKTMRKRHTVSWLISKMEKQGYIKKVKDFPRKSQFRVVLTQKGEEALREAVKRESIHRIISVLSQEQRRQLLSSLPALLESAFSEAGLDPKLAPEWVSKKR